MQRPRQFVVLLAATFLVATASNRSEQQPRTCCAVLELRQYTMKPGQRDVLVALFDRHFVEPQEADGMTIVGQFRDRQRPDRFVWIRGFSDMTSRLAGLERFYGGPIWAEHKATANSTMVDVSDVLLLKPAGPQSSLRFDSSQRPAVGEERAATMVIVGMHRLREPATETMTSKFESEATPMLKHEGIEVESVFVTESSPNTFTRLPVREGEHFLVWFGTLRRGSGPSVERLQGAGAVLGTMAQGPMEILQLDPTPRSLYGHHRPVR